MWEERDEIDITYWRLCDEFTIQEAALLIAGKNPSDLTDVEQHHPGNQPRRYLAARNALLRAIEAGTVKGTIIRSVVSDTCGNLNFSTSTISVESLVERESVRSWLQSRGITSGFFFSGESTAVDYLNAEHPRYAPKLAAALRAWMSVTDPGSKTPKQALVRWLRENAAQFALTDDEGNPNETGIEEIAKVANWQPGGGAPKTPG